MFRARNALSDTVIRKGSRKRKISIRWTLPLCVIAPLLSGIVLTNWLSYRSGQRAVEDLVNKISNEVTANIEKQVNSYLTRSTMVSASLQTEVESGNLDLENIRTLGDTLWHFTQVEMFSNNIFYGNEKGEFVYSDFYQNQSRLDFVDEATEFERVAYETDDAGNPTSEIKRNTYDPRLRDWYQAAAETGEPIWAPAYIANSRSALTITRATPIFRQDGQLWGVFGIDVYLVELSNFLQELTISTNGRAFIMEPAGELIAISAEEDPFIEKDGEMLQLPATESQDPLVREAAQGWLDGTLSAQAGDNPSAYEFEIAGEKQLAYIYPLQEVGVDWIVGVVIPQNDYMETINASARRTFFIGALVTGVASLVAVGAALYIVYPIQQLNQAAEDIKNNRYAPESLTEVMSRPDEFRDLAKLFNDMAMVVVSREQSLAEQVDVLKSEIAQQGHRSSRHELEALIRKARQTREQLLNGQ